VAPATAIPTSARVVALDVTEEKLELAKEVEAHHGFISDEDAVDRIKELTGGKGVQAVFDFVVAQPTIDLGQDIVAVGADQVLVEVGAGTAKAGLLTNPYDSSIRAPYWGSRSELFEVLELARSGAIDVQTEVFSLDDAPDAYERLHESTLRGRAVIVP